MSKIHYSGFVYVACGLDERSVSNTYDVNKVTCKRCKKTTSYKVKQKIEQSRIL